MDLHKLKVEIVGESKKLKAEFDESLKAAKAVKVAINKELDKIGNSPVGKQLTKQMEIVRKQAAAMRQTVNEAKESAGIIKQTKEYKEVQKEIKRTTDQITRLQEKQAGLAGEARAPTAAYERIQQSIKDTKKELDELIEKQEKWASLGGAVTQSKPFQDLENQIEKTHSKLEDFERRQRAMEKDGTGFAPSEKWKKLQRQIGAAKEELSQYKAKEGTMAAKKQDYQPAGASGSLKNMRATMSGIGRYTKGISEGSLRAGKVAQRGAKIAVAAWKGMSTGIGKPLRAVGKLSAGFVKLTGRIKSAIPAFNKAKRGMDGMYSGSNALTRGLKILTMTAKFMIASMLFMGAINGMKEGFKSLSQYSDKTNNSLSMLQGALIQLRNALATAFAPILNVIAPAISQFIGWISAALNTVGQFFAALTGQKSVIVAKQVNTDFAGSFGDAGESADDAKDKVEEYKKSLMGFDQINKLKDPTKDAGGSSGSGSGGASGPSPGQMFETVEVGNVYSGWADKFKEAWKNADFTEIGGIVGDKLNHALENIPWTKIKATSAKIAKSLATFLNGFIDKTDWNLVGGTFAEGINTAIEFCYSFVTNFDFSKFGTAIGNAINGFFERLDLAKAAKTLSEGLKGVFDSAINLLKTTDFKMIGEKVVEFFANIDWVGLFTKLVEGIGALGEGIGDFFIGIFDDLGKRLSDYVASGALWKDIKNVGGTVLEVSVSLVKKGWDTVTSFVGAIVKVAISLFKSGWSLLKDFVGDKVDVLVSRVKNWKESFNDWVKAKAEMLVSRVKNWSATFSNWVKARAEMLVSRARNWTASFSDWVKARANMLVTRVRNWSASFNSWVKAKAEILMSRKKNWTAKFTDWLGITKGFLLKFKLPKIKVKWGSKTVAGFTIKYPNGFSTYAKGGFPEEGPFFMNQGEIAGKFSNGKSVVANNQQITDGIANAVGPAVYAAMISALSHMPREERNGNVIIRLEGDAKKFFKAMREEAAKFTETTGISPFPV